MTQLAPTAVEPTELKGLMESTSSPAISIYLPTVRATAQPEENSLQLKNSLGGVEDDLVQRGMRRPEMAKLLEPLRSLLADRDFWSHQQEGLALLRTPDVFESFRLPFAVQPRAVVADSPYLAPLFRSLGHNKTFYVLALSQGAVRLIESGPHGAQEVDLSALDVPLTLDEALRYDDFQKPQSMHSSSAGPGHGEEEEDRKSQVRRYAQAVDAGVARYLGSSGAPLVLAAVEWVRAIYRETSDYRAVLKGGIDGNPDHLRPAQLIENALPIMRAQWEGQMADLKDRYETGLAHDGAACELEDVLWAARDGRVDTLFVREGADEWGEVDETARSIKRTDQRGPGIAELHDLAIRQSVATGGSVLVLDAEAMPCDGPIAAIYRY